MSGIAFVLKQKGYSVSGSDKRENTRIKKLKRSGITIFEYQESSNIKRITQNTKEKDLIIVISSAISKDN